MRSWRWVPVVVVHNGHHMLEAAPTIVQVANSKGMAELVLEHCWQMAQSPSQEQAGLAGAAVAGDALVGG